MSIEKVILGEKKPYESPKLTRHGDVEAITLGDDLGDDMDAAFTTSASPLAKKKRKKDNRFS
jgi:hypothetical protein